MYAYIYICIYTRYLKVRAKDESLAMLTVNFD